MVGGWVGCSHLCRVVAMVMVPRRVAMAVMAAAMVVVMGDSALGLNLGRTPNGRAGQGGGHLERTMAVMAAVMAVVMEVVMAAAMVVVMAAGMAAVLCFLGGWQS